MSFNENKDLGFELEDDEEWKVSAGTFELIRPGDIRVNQEETWVPDADS
jgi:hypothetical protein